MGGVSGKSKKGVQAGQIDAARDGKSILSGAAGGAAATDAAPRFVLLEPSHPGNVGATARALKVMGFSDLVLVAPRYANVRGKADAIALASGALDVLDGARIVEHLDDALGGIDYVCATVMTPRDFGPPTYAPRPLFAELVSARRRLAFVFGSERYGMSNEDVYRCHAAVSIPTNPGYGSLNLSQAVQLIAYEWRIAIGGFDARTGKSLVDLADVPMVSRVLEDWRALLTEVDFLNPSSPKKLMARLRSWLYRSTLTQEEAHILLGISRSIRARQTYKR